MVIHTGIFLSVIIELNDILLILWEDSNIGVPSYERKNLMNFKGILYFLLLISNDNEI